MREVVVGTEVAGFTVEEERGSGGFGTVYKARRGGRLFALKLIRLQGAGEWGEREVDILRKLRHPNVVGFRGCGYWPDAAPRFLFIVLEYVEGLPLDAWARAHNPSARELVRKLLPLVEALGAVHAAGVVHRDVKESNILVREEDGQPVLVDFGSGAYAEARRITEGVLPPGTAEYRGPEAWRFALADTAESDSGSYQPGPEADLWALGVVLYRLLTGVLPFGHRQQHKGMVRAILHEAPVPPHERNPRVPRALGALCLRLLEKPRAARLAEAPALGAALKAALAEADEAWDVPLGVQEWDAPSEVHEARPPAEAPAAPVPLAAGTARSGRASRRAWRGAAGAALTAALLAAGAYALGARATREVGTDLEPIGSLPPLTTYQGGDGQEVAPPWKPRESSEGAALSRTVSPAPVAAATLQKEDTRVKTPPKKRLGTLVGACTTAAALTQGACAMHPILRPPPPPEECPQGAVATMEKLGIEIGQLAIAYPPGVELETIKVREGNVTLKLLSKWPKLMGKPLLYGRFIFGGKRVHGRFTQMMHPSGYMIPVCFEVWDYEGGRGSDEEGERGLGTAIIFGKMEVKAVDRFE
jgi:serine/threonine-protein kinase